MKIKQRHLKPLVLAGLLGSASGAVLAADDLNRAWPLLSTATDVHGVRNTLADTTGGEILKLAGGKLTLGVFEINIPHRATMTAEQADLWLKNSGAQITNFLDHNASLQDQAAHAANMSVDLVLAARNALADPHEAVYLGATKPPKTYEQLRATIAKENAGAGGDALDQKIIEAAVKQTKELGCFVAGTLVHTREGLRPIEQIQVGDYVLSKPESGDGETSYQPVTKTFSYENRELYLVNMTELDPSTGRVVNGKSEYVAVTGAHPIWVQSFKQLNWVEDVRVITPVNGWVSVEDIYLKNCHAYWAGPEEQLTGPDALVLLANGAPAIMHSPEPILKAHLSNEGVLFADNDTWIEDGCMGRKLLFSANGVEFVQGSVALGDAKAAGYDYTDYDIDSARSVVKRSGGHLPIRRTVYNLEVAHNHSYFVGELGMWVHNTSGLELRPLPLSPTQNLDIFVGDEAEIRLTAELAKRADGKGMAIKPDIEVIQRGQARIKRLELIWFAFEHPRLHLGDRYPHHPRRTTDSIEHSSLNRAWPLFLFSAFSPRMIGNTMKPSTALNAHRDAIRRIVESHRAGNARVFGSVIHGDDTEESDLDILIDPTSETTLMDVAVIQVELEHLLGVAVDILTPNALPAKFRGSVLAEAVPV